MCITVSLLSNMCYHTPFEDTKLCVTRVTPNIQVRPSAMFLLTMGKKSVGETIFKVY
jgi:hypothetical protein